MRYNICGDYLKFTDSILKTAEKIYLNGMMLLITCIGPFGKVIKWFMLVLTFFGIISPLRFPVYWDVVKGWLMIDED